MDPLIWRQVLSRLDPRDRRLRPGLSHSGLAQLEANLGLRLPSGFRSFLTAHDGGWIGDQKIYGSPEIRRMLELGRDRFHGPAETRGRWSRIEAAYRPLLPIHPASSESVECLALEPRRSDQGDDGTKESTEEDAAVVWVRFPGMGPVDSVEKAMGIRHIDVDVLTWSRADPGRMDAGEARALPQVEATYADFLDWILDAVLIAGTRLPELSGTGRIEAGWRS